MEHVKNVSFPKYASIALEISIGKTLDYGIPDLLLPSIKKGVQVKIPVRGRLYIGYVVDVKETSPFKKVFPIHEIVQQDLLSPELTELAMWISRYYGAPLGQVLKCMLPPSIRQNKSHKEQFYVMRVQTKERLREACISLRESHPSQANVLDVMLMAKKGLLLTELIEKAEVSKSPIDTLIKKGLLSIDIVRIDRSPLSGEDYFKTQPKKLTEEQQVALDKIVLALKEKRFETHLLFGVTGSGKTEVYLQAITQALELGLGTIMLVPEISLTMQTIERFRSRFDNKIAILHHRLSTGERHDEWHRILRGEASIVVGARSALFSPIKELGLIIVDEEHDGAYKQSDEEPCYHARDTAVMRGHIQKAVVILGSATPSIESFYNAQKGKYVLSTLKARAAEAALPSITIVDMNKEYEKARGPTSFSGPLIDAIKKRVEIGEQTILFLNRRGYHTSLHCGGCGQVCKCPRCDLPLTFHRNDETLSCHLCDFRLRPPPRICAQCKCQTMKFKGVGTELIEKALHAILPEARTLRIDGDTTRHKGSHERFFRAFSTGKADVLIGTQMIAKGLHFPAVTLVAVLNCDAGLHIPDFRASEQIFQLITQVAGRAGRGHLPGEVIIQTQMPTNATIQLAAKQDFITFYQTEIESRKLFGFPPFSHLIKLTFSGKDSAFVEEIGHLLRKGLIEKLGGSFLVHPLAPSGYAKIKDHFRFQCLIHGPKVYPVNEAIGHVLEKKPLPSGVRLHLDVDPLSTYF